MHDGFGRTTGKGLRLIMVHVIAKDGPLVTRAPFSTDEPGEGQTVFLMQEGRFKSKGGNYFSIGNAEKAEFLWQAKLAKGDSRAAMTDKIFMLWLEQRITPAYEG